MTKIYFSDFFAVSPDLVEEYGAFDISLINDLPLFIDPFLLFNSENQTYQELHEAIINYMRFLKDVSSNEDLPQPLIREWFTFHEIKQNWLGVSKYGNDGRGLGPKFAKSLYQNFNNVFQDFGNETVTRTSHLEKLCLMQDGVGRDNISDFTTNLIMNFLAEFTQIFATNYLEDSQRRPVTLRKIRFNYDTRSWVTESFVLPYIHGDFVLLTPKNILTKDQEWINRPELLDRFPEIAEALPNATLRAQVNDYLVRTIPIGPKVTKQEIRDAISKAVERYPEVLDYYIRDKEDSGEHAVSLAEARVREVETVFIDQVRSLVTRYLDPSGFYKIPCNTYEESRGRVMFLKDVIETKGAHKLFYINGNPIEREADLQILFRLTWYGTSSDVTREANDGRGPADYKISRGASDKTIVEFKLAKNTHLERNLQKQCQIYEAASDATHPSIKVILYFDESQYKKVVRILKKLKLEGNENIILIDACDFNKPSGSNA